MVKIIFSVWPQRFMRLVIGALFIYAGVLKLTDVGSFASVIAQFELLPFGTTYMAYALPLFEIVCGFGLIINFKGSLTAITTLTIFFIAILLYGIKQDLDVPCGCFGPEDPEFHFFAGMWGAIYRDLLILLGLGYVYIYRFVNVSAKLPNIK